MAKRRKPIKVNEAIVKLMDFAIYGKTEFVPIEASYGRIVAADIIADHPVPPFDRSPFDGFALRSADTQSSSSANKISFEVIGEIGAGSIFTEEVGANEAVRIMTGTAIPADCDAVIKLESVTEYVQDEKNYFYLKRRLSSGENISFTGEDTQEGTILVSKGTYINPGVVAVLATFGYKDVPVSVKPKVGIIATGSELLDVGSALEPGKIRNSNAYMVYSQVLRAGGDPIYFGKLSDEFEPCFNKVKDTVNKVDFLITTGGVSVGDFDYLPAIYERLGADILFNKVGMRPGSVTTVAAYEGKLLFGLSGNPSACYVGFELYARPLIRTYLQTKAVFSKKETAVLGADFPKANPFDRFVRANLSYETGKLVATPVGFDKSNAVTSLAGANVLIVLPGGTRGYEKGMDVSVILLEDQEGASLEAFTAPHVKAKGS